MKRRRTKKSHRALDVGFAGKRQLINKLRAHYSVGELCEVLELPRSSYYYGEKRQTEKNARAEWTRCESA